MLQKRSGDLTYQDWQGTAGIEPSRTAPARQQRTHSKEQTATCPVADVFISYSRKDKEFVQRLDESLKCRGREAWVDWEGIQPTDTLGDFINSIRKAERPRQHVMDYAEDNGERRGRVIARTPAATAALQLPGRPAAGICACRAADPALRYRLASPKSRVGWSENPGATELGWRKTRRRLAWTDLPDVAS